MNIMPVSKVMRNLPDILKTIEDDDCAFTITRKGKAVGILITPERYDALLETIEILGDKQIIRALESSRQDFNKGRVFSHKEVWQDKGKQPSAETRKEIHYELAAGMSASQSERFTFQN